MNVTPFPVRATPAAHVIVFGNEKGGSGKSTAAMHVAVGLLKLGFTVGTIDLDARQGTFTRYLENRWARAQAQPLPCPTHIAVARSAAENFQEAAEDERERLAGAFRELQPYHDFVVVDTPGSDTFLSRLGHSHADTLVTPINDSFIDLDLLATVDPETHKVVRPSIYSETVWEQRKQRALRDGGSMDWIVMRNRLSHLNARNKQEIAAILEKLARRIGFRTTPGFGERVIFRELFLKGLTLLDLGENAGEPSLTISQVAARQEVRALLEAIRPVGKAELPVREEPPYPVAAAG
jgi:chromosome partitioning protein